MYNNALDNNSTTTSAATTTTGNISIQQQQQSRLYSNPQSPMVNMQPKLEQAQFHPQYQQQQHLQSQTPPQQQQPTSQMISQQQYHNQNNFYQQQFNNNPNPNNQYQMLNQNQQLQHHLQQQQQQQQQQQHLNGNQIYNQTTRMCASCYSPINDQIVMECSNRYWHYNCLRCNLCKKNLSENERCYMRDDTIMCKEDYIKYVY